MNTGHSSRSLPILFHDYPAFNSGEWKKAWEAVRFPCLQLRCAAVGGGFTRSSEAGRFSCRCHPGPPGTRTAGAPPAPPAPPCCGPARGLPRRGGSGAERRPHGGPRSILFTPRWRTPSFRPLGGDLSQNAPQKSARNPNPGEHPSQGKKKALVPCVS